MSPKKNTKFNAKASKSTESSSKIPVIEVEELYENIGQSRFVLRNLQYYSVHPNMAKYYEPLKPSKLQRFLTRKKKIDSFMLKVAEYDQDLTLLLMTNNPPPCSICLEENDSAPKYFPQEFQLKETQYLHKPTTRDFFLPTMPKKKLRPKLKAVFPVKQLDESASKKRQWFRFSTDKDFKSEGKYSEVHALRKQKTMYPKLTFASPCSQEEEKAVSQKPESSMATRHVQWEPLTFTKLLGKHPIRSAPGESSFRYGRAQQWIIDDANVIK